MKLDNGLTISRKEGLQGGEEKYTEGSRAALARNWRKVPREAPLRQEDPESEEERTVQKKGQTTSETDIPTK